MKRAMEAANIDKLEQTLLDIRNATEVRRGGRMINLSKADS